MKTVTIYLINFLFTTVFFAQDKGNLTVTFEDFENPKGIIYIAVFEKDNFLRQPLKTSMLEIESENNQVIVEDLAFGEYAISVFHDLNGNGQFDMDGNQRPAEPWAMSGSVNPMQMPNWESAKFEFSASGQDIKLFLIK